MKNYRLYTPEEDQKIQDFYAIYDKEFGVKCTLKSFSESISRHPKSITGRARILGVYGKVDHHFGSKGRSSRWYEYNVDENGCWNPRTKQHTDRASCSFLGGMRLRRCFYIKYSSDIPKGLVLKVQCENRMCVNPKHIKTTIRGECAIAQAKITQPQVDESFNLRSKGWKLKQIADRYGVSKSLICHIHKGRRWVGRTFITQ